MQDAPMGILPERPAEESFEIHGDPTALFAALSAAQGEFPDIPRTKTVRVRTKSGETYTFDYSPLDNTIATLRPVLAKHGIAVLQPPCDGPYDGTGSPLRIVTILAGHGAYIKATFGVPLVDDIKQQGGIITYIRRYQYEGLLGVFADTDDDGNLAAGDHRDISDRRPRRQAPPAQAVEETPRPRPPQATEEAPKQKAEQPAKQPASQEPTPEQREEFRALCKARGLSKMAAAEKLRAAVGKVEGLSAAEVQVAIDMLRAEVAAAEGGQP